MSDVADKITDSSNDLAGFHQYIGERLKEGGDTLSPEEALDIWRHEHPLPEDYEETVEALREALADMEAGDVGIPLEEFDAEFRARHNLSPRK
jgi:hypothetical protein